MAEFGPNAVAEEKVHPVKRVLRHFWSPVPWMLEATIALQILIGERVEALMIVALLLLNVALGVFQETRANATLELLKQRLAPRVKVRRDGAWADRPAADIVPDDVVQLSLGGIVPADLRILTGTVLLDQSMLTGESIAVDAGVGKTAYAGALVRRGEATGEVVATGAHTFFGRTAELVRIAHVESSEQKAVMGVVRALTVVNFAIVIGMVAYARFHRHGRAADHSARADSIALGSAGCPAGDLHLGVSLGGPDAGIERRAADAAHGPAGGRDDRRALRRQDRHADGERAQP